jgi:hypothetical protein
VDNSREIFFLFLTVRSSFLITRRPSSPAADTRADPAAASSAHARSRRDPGCRRAMLFCLSLGATLSSPFPRFFQREVIENVPLERRGGTWGRRDVVGVRERERKSVNRGVEFV